MATKKTLHSGLIRFGMLVLGVSFGACGGGGSPTTPTAASSSTSSMVVGVSTELGTVSVNASKCADIDLAEVARHFNRDLDKPCQQQMGIRTLDASGLLLECERSHQYVGQFFPPQHIVFAREQALRHERDHWAARELGLPCWAEVDHSVDFCCQPL